MGFKQKLSRILKNKYRFIIYNDTNYKQIWSSGISGWVGLGVVGPIILLFIFIIFAIIAFTPVRNLIPGYPDSKTRQNLIYNAEKIDSLENMIVAWERYVDCIQTIATGETNASTETQTTVDTIGATELIGYTLSPEDSIFRVEMEMEERARLATNKNEQTSIFTNTFLYPPLKGTITTPFSKADKHFGVDIDVATSSVVTAALDGTIISTGWVFGDEYVVQIQHPNNLISIYKGASMMLKTIGEYVKAGEAIAVIGNANDPSKSSSLHFELWLNGAPVDPVSYVNF